METMPAGFVYLENVFGEEDEQQLLQELRTLEYRQDQFRGKLLKRSAAHFGYAYLATGRRLLSAEPFPAFLSAVIDKCLPYCPSGAKFTQCLVSRYPPGAGIGWHVDAPQFGEYVAGVSLGSVARLMFRPAKQAETGAGIAVAPRSVYIMSGSARWSYEHRITPVKAVRYSLTFRSVMIRNEEVPHVKTASPRDRTTALEPPSTAVERSETAIKRCP